MGKKAKFNGYMMIFCSVIMLSSPLYRAYYLYSVHTKMDSYTVEFKEWELEKAASDKKWKKKQDDFIQANPRSPVSGYYLYEQGKLKDAEKLIDSLVINHVEEAIFAKHTMNIDEELYAFDKEISLTALGKLCDEYIEPCMFLANYFIENRNFDQAFFNLNKVKHIEDPEIYSQLRWLYSVKTWRNYDKKKAEHYGKLFAKTSKDKCCKSNIFYLTKYTKQD